VLPSRAEGAQEAPVLFVIFLSAADDTLTRFEEENTLDGRVFYWKVCFSAFATGSVFRTIEAERFGPSFDRRCGSSLDLPITM